MFRHKIPPIVLFALVFCTVTAPFFLVGIKQEGTKLYRYIQQYQEYQDNYNQDGSNILEV